MLVRIALVGALALAAAQPLRSTTSPAFSDQDPTRVPNSAPHAQNEDLGWIILGRSHSPNLDLWGDGRVLGSGTSALRSPGDDTPWDGVREHLREVSSRLGRRPWIRGKEQGTEVANGRLDVYVFRKATFGDLLRIMSLCAEPEVVLADIHWVDPTRGDRRYPVPLPVDAGAETPEELEFESQPVRGLPGLESPRPSDLAIALDVSPGGERRIRLTLDDTPLGDAAELVTALRERAARTPKRGVRISGSPGITFDELVPILDALDAAGVKNPSFIAHH